MYIYWPDDEVLVVKSCWSVNYNKRQKMFFWWGFFFFFFVPNSDISLSSCQKMWPKILKLSRLMRFWFQHRQCNEHIQGSIETKFSKLHWIWTNTKRIFLIKWKNTVQIWRKLFCLMTHLVRKFVVSKAGYQVSLFFQ
jgi:hypothetical protein